MRIAGTAGALGALVALAALAAAPRADAGSFTIAPVRVEMDRARTTGVVTLHNDADQPVTVQAQAVAWSQPDGSDRYEPTREILVTPPVFVIPPKGEQIVRVANRAPAATDAEKSWRLVFEEVPDASPVQANTLRVALKISIPVFGVVPGARHELAFATRRGADGKAELVATNSGLAHVQLTDFDVLGPDGAVVTRITGSRYLLPGASAAWPVTLPDGVAAGGALRVRGHSDRGDLAAEVAAAPKTP